MTNNMSRGRGHNARFGQWSRPKKRGVKKTKFVLSETCGYKAPRHGMRWLLGGNEYIEVSRHV